MSTAAYDDSLDIVAKYFVHFGLLYILTNLYSELEVFGCSSLINFVKFDWFCGFLVVKSS